MIQVSANALRPKTVGNCVEQLAGQPQITCGVEPADAAAWDWRLVDHKGMVNWGLLLFVVLSSTCLAVWAGIAIQYMQYLRSACHSHLRSPPGCPTPVCKSWGWRIQPPC